MYPLQGKIIETKWETTRTPMAKKSKPPTLAILEVLNASRLLSSKVDEYVLYH
jgi:hypothetical protein